MTDKDTIPAWDGTARTWRRYTREVGWYFRATPTHKRQYVATKLLSRLTGSARLLAMSWADMSLDDYNGTRTLLQRLAASPLVRQSIPNASATCAQYFDFRRKPGESMTAFLVRESLGYSEFVESLVRLAEEKKGIKQESKDFGLPPPPEESSWEETSSGWEYWDERWQEEWQENWSEHEERAGGRNGAAVDPSSPSGSAFNSMRAAAGSVAASRHSVGVQPSVAAGDDLLSELSFADSFVLGVLRGYRLLQAAGLSPEERRDILSSTGGSLEFEHVTKALQTLWDEQFLGARHAGHSSNLHFQETFHAEVNGDDQNASWHEDAFWADDWSSWQDWDWSEAQMAEQPVESVVDEDDPSIKEAQQAERVAESLALEAQRTWSDAQKATAALRRDRGFGQHAPSNGGGKGRGPCFICWGPHLSRECPDRQHPSRWKGKGKGKQNYMAEYDESQNPQYYEDYYVNKGKGKKGKSAHWMDAQFWSKGKSQNRFAGKGQTVRPPVNAYHSEMFFGGLEMLGEPHEMQTTAAERLPNTHGLLDCGATASAGPQIAVENLVNAVLAKDSQAQIKIHQGDRPYFRFGNGRWGRALYKVEIVSKVSGTTRQFKLYALPNPADLHRPDFDVSTLVPILVGMDHLSGTCSAMTVDFMTGLALDSCEPHPSIYKLPSNKKGHYILDIIYFLTRGHTMSEGHPHVHVVESVNAAVSENHFIQFMPLEFDSNLTEMREQFVEPHVLELSRRNLMKVHEYKIKRLASQPQLSAQMQTSPVGDLNSILPDCSSHVTRPNLQAQCSAGRPDVGRSLGDSRKGEASAVRCDSTSWAGSTRSTDEGESMAMLRPTRGGCAKGKPTRTMASLQGVQCPPALHSQGGLSWSNNQVRESSSGSVHARPVEGVHAGSSTLCRDLSGYAKEDRCGDGAEEGSDRAPRKPRIHFGEGEAQVQESANIIDKKISESKPLVGCDITAEGESRGIGGGVDRLPGAVGSSGVEAIGGGTQEEECLECGEFADSDRERRHEHGLSTGGAAGVKKASSLKSSMVGSTCKSASTASSNGKHRKSPSSPSMSSPLTRTMAAKVLLMASTLVTSMTAMATDFLLSDRDGVWEIACAPHSWLSEACAQQGLRPRRINLSEGYDLYKEQTWQHLRELRRKHKPRRLWFSLPCTRWCQWSYINYSTPERKMILAQLRRKEIKMLWHAAGFIEEALLEDPLLDIYFEWPHPCVGWHQAPLKYLEELLQRLDREWLRCRIDGCNYGLRERDGQGDHLRKQWLVRTTSQSFHAIFRAKVCPGGHRHSVIEGAETAKSSYYPWRMVKAIARAWRQELLSDRSHRLLFAHEDQPSMISLEEELLAMEETTLSCFPAVRSQDEVAEVVPSPEELQRWKARVAQFHRAAGHPTNRNLARVVRDSGAPRWQVQVALDHHCGTCASLKPGGMSSGQIPPIATHSLAKAWHAVGMDTAEWTVPALKKKARFLLMIDLATKLRVVYMLKTYPELEMQSESADEVIHAFCDGWLAHYPKPAMVVPDNAKSFISTKFHEFMQVQGIHLHFPPEKEPWSHGIVEAAVKDVKHVATAIQMESLDNEPALTLALTASALNSTEYTAGFSAHQWAFGAKYSIADEDVRVWHSVDPQADFLNVARARQEAEEVARKTRAKRVLSKLANTTVRQPIRLFKTTDLVMVWRKVQPGEQHQGSRGGLKKSGRPHWVGPGRVVFAEAVPHQESDDPRQHILWILMGRKLWRCSVHSVRPVSETERLSYEVSSPDPTQWKTLADILPQREFVDITAEEPREDEIEFPDLPPEPDETTYAPIRRAHGKKTLGPSDWKTVHRSAPVGTVRDAPQPRHFVPSVPATASSAQPPLEDQQDDYTPEAVNDYENETIEAKEPDAKRVKMGDASTYDLKWLEILEVEAAQEVSHEDVFSVLETYEGECLSVEIELDFVSHRQRRNFMHNPVMFLVKKLNNSEVNLKTLSPADRILFGRAKGKEVNSFLKNAAVRKCLDDKELQEAFGSGRILKARWVLTWKPIPPDEREEAIHDVATNENTLIRADASKKAKARIVLLGFQHPSLLDRNFKTSAPVISSLGKNIMYMASVLHQWPLEGLDLATAFLQTMPTEADDQLYTFGVPELREALGAPEGSCLRILKNIYGSTTAPRGLWLSLSKTLEELDAVAALGERCLWMWFSKTEVDPSGFPKLLGMMGGHVDDFHRIGDRSSAEWCEICERIDKAYQWGTTKKGSYRHAGSDVHTIYDKSGQFRIKVEQDSYVESLLDVDIAPERLRSNGPLSSKEVGACRTALGGLQWLAVQTQPLLTSRCNLLLSEITRAGTLEHAREIQQMIGEVRANATSLEFFPLPDVKSWQDVVFIGMGDQAHANRACGDSTGGMIILASGPSAVSGNISKMMLLAWRTWRLKRKAIGSNDAEVQSILETEDVTFRVRLLWAECHGARLVHPGQLREDMVDVAERLARLLKGILCTDSRGGYDAVEVNESPLLGLSNLRAALQAFQLRDNLRRVGCELRWLASDYDLADALTKKRAESRAGLLRFLQTWEWAIAFDPTFTAAKKNKKVGMSALDRLASERSETPVVFTHEPSLTEEGFFTGADWWNSFACDVSQC